MTTEMSSFSSNRESLTLWNLYERAAKLMYGNDIQVCNNPANLEVLRNIRLLLTVENASQATERTRTVVDVTHKEYTNNSKIGS